MPNQFMSSEGDLENYFVSEYWLIDQYIGDTLWVWGRNNQSGQLGDNTLINKSTPVTTFAGGNNWKHISGGNGFAAIKTDGSLWLWGTNAYGQLGINSVVNKSTPVTTLSGGNNWKQVSMGPFHTAAIKTDGTLWSWGSNSSGSLGTNAAQGGVGVGKRTPMPIFGGGNNWKQVSIGSSHTAAIKTDGSLWLWGNNQLGELGINSLVTMKCTPVTTFVGGNDWKFVSAGSTGTSALKTDGTLWTWGSATGDAFPASSRCTPGQVFGGGTNWKSVSAGRFMTCAIKTDGTLWVWGFNSYANLGTNDAIQRNTPVPIFGGGTNWKSVSAGGSGSVSPTETYTAAIKTDGTLWTWGTNSYICLGINGAGTRCTPVTTFAGGTNWKQVTAGTHSVGAITSGTDPTFFIS